MAIVPNKQHGEPSGGPKEESSTGEWTTTLAEEAGVQPLMTLSLLTP